MVPWSSACNSLSGDVVQAKLRKYGKYGAPCLHIFNFPCSVPYSKAKCKITRVQQRNGQLISGSIKARQTHRQGSNSRKKNIKKSYYKATTYMNQPTKTYQKPVVSFSLVHVQNSWRLQHWVAVKQDRHRNESGDAPRINSAKWIK